MKFVRKLTDSTVLVHIATVEPEVWKNFWELAQKSTIKNPDRHVDAPIYDGRCVIVESFLPDKNFSDVRSISASQGASVNKFLLDAGGDIFGPRCFTD